LTAFVVALAASPSALSQGREESREEPRQQVAFYLGLASPLGFGGFALSAALAPRLRVEVGVGYGLTGAQFSLMPKYALELSDPSRHLLLGLGASLSLRQTDPAKYESKLHRTAYAVWVNPEAAFELRSASNVTLTVAFGFSIGVASDFLIRIPKIVNSDSFENPQGMVLPQVRLGLGYAF